MQLREVAAILKAEVDGDPALEVTRLVHPADGTGAADLAVALAGDAAAALAGTRAAAVVVQPDATAPAGVALIRYRGHERMALAILTRAFERKPDVAPGVHPSAVVAATAKIAAGVAVGPFVAVGERSAVGAGTVLMAGATVGANVTIGRDCVIHSGARIGDGVRIGDRVTIYANAVVGGDGFSVIPLTNPDGSKNPLELPVRIRSLGGVQIGDDVEIGASTTIDRGTLRDTVIGRGTKIDNQVQIAHNVIIGEAAIICGTVGIAGSSVIGDRVILAAGAGVADHVSIGADAIVSARAAVITDIAAGTLVDGVPALPRVQALERYANVGRLKMLYPRVDDLKKRMEALENRGKGG
jgi:UDP-3-O-[3-hydroxymyristoyl] glucosamine N-acyltransferase